MPFQKGHSIRPKNQSKRGRGVFMGQIEFENHLADKKHLPKGAIIAKCMGVQVQRIQSITPTNPAFYR